MALNKPQQEACDYIDGPCLVLAGAGSGKTRVITAKIVSLILTHGYRPERICAVTFTNKAAAEMRERVAREIGADTAHKIVISTFHSLGLAMLRHEHNAVGLSANFSLFDEYDKKKIVSDIIKDRFPQLTVNTSEKTVTETQSAFISRMKGELKGPDDLGFKGADAEIYRLYEDYLHACNAVDFDDLIFLPTRLFTDKTEAGERLKAWFDYVLVDEYQDTNETQYELLKALTQIHQRFTVVGDDDQSIYSWRGANPENIRLIGRDFPNLKVIKLEENYRCTRRILHCANGLIAKNAHQYQKTLFSNLAEGRRIQVFQAPDEAAEAEAVVADIYGHHFVHHDKYACYAVLYRSNFQSQVLEKCFRENRIPVVITGGSSFFELREVKDIMAWCRVVCNPRDDVALLRVINVPRRGIGAETLARLSEMAKKTGKSMFDCTLSPEVVQTLTAQQMKALSSFVRVLVQLRGMFVSDRDLELSQKLVDIVGYEGYINASQASKAAKSYQMANVKQLMGWIEELIRGRKGEEPMYFKEAVDRLGLREMLDRQGNTDENDAVQLMTLHAAKGLEFPFVYIVGVEEGILPHRNSIEDEDGESGGVEEERRLMYVGITRARKELTLSGCRQRGKAEQQRIVRPSRFLSELPPEDLERHEDGEQTVYQSKLYEQGTDNLMEKLLKLQQELSGKK